MKNKLLIFFAVGCGFIPLAEALKTDAAQPIQIVADHMSLDQKNMLTRFTGNVVVTQGSILVHSNTAEASQDPAGFKHLHLLGTPVTFTQLEDDGDKVEGQGNTFDYNTQNNLAILIGRARVKKGNDLVMGDKLTYNTQTQIYSATSTNADGTSNRKSGRVTVILQPDQKGSNGSNSNLNLQ